MDNKQKILNLIRMRGPSLPVHISKQVNTNILMASAMLSEMVSRGELKVSSIKLGSSPLYYIKGQESQLQKYADRLNFKDKRTYETLKDKKVLRDKLLQPIERVSLRQIKDFAVPLKVKIGSEVELFWKWYLLPNNEAELILKKFLQSTRVEPKQEIPKPNIKHEVRPQPIKKHEAQKIPKNQPIIKQEAKQQPKKFVDTTTGDEFISLVRNYFSKNKIDVIEQKIIRKKSEIDFIIKIPSAVGTLTYYCKAKSKKRSNDTDLASALVQSQMKKLPAIYLITGDLTKRAKDMLHKEFKGMTIKKIENGN